MAETSEPSLLEGSNYHQTRRHYATEMQLVPRGGAKGVALCSRQDLEVLIYDQKYHDRLAEQYRDVAKDNDSLPLCKRCVQKAAKLLAAA